jgi:hypothetical protein
MNNRLTDIAAGIKRKLTLTGSAIALLLTAGIGHAAVLVSLTDNDGTPTVGFGDAGQPFTITVRLQSSRISARVRAMPISKSLAAISRDRLSAT